MAVALPDLPAPFKPLQHYLRIASDHDTRDPPIAYYCRMCVLQKGMAIDKKSPECKTYLLALMDMLETFKASMPDNEAIHSEVVGQAHVETYALKLFLFADNEDRAGRFSKNLPKTFFTSALLLDVVETIGGEISEELSANRKYAKWKATYIARCFKSGEQPVAGPTGSGFEDENPPPGVGGAGGPITSFNPGPSGSDPSAAAGPGPGPSTSYGGAGGGGGGFYQPPPPQQQPPAISFTGPSPVVPHQPPPPAAAGAAAPSWMPPSNATGVQLTSDQMNQAMKYCKHASSALQYDDSKTAIDLLTKCLHLLTTGKDT